jgi:hypothetical protein
VAVNAAAVNEVGSGVKCSLENRWRTGLARVFLAQTR